MYLSLLKNENKGIFLESEICMTNVDGDFAEKDAYKRCEDYIN